LGSLAALPSGQRARSFQAISPPALTLSLTISPKFKLCLYSNSSRHPVHPFMRSGYLAGHTRVELTRVALGCPLPSPEDGGHLLGGQCLGVMQHCRHNRVRVRGVKQGPRGKPLYLVVAGPIQRHDRCVIPPKQRLVLQLAGRPCRAMLRVLSCTITIHRSAAAVLVFPR
jgi:hypothetical protein